MGSSLSKDRVKVCILTSVHPPFDGRIFHREAKTLVRAGHEVVLIAQHDKEEIVDGVRILPLPRPKNRLERATKIVWSLFRSALKQKADVYHFHDPELIPVGLVLKVFGKKVIYDVHEHYPNSILDKYWIIKSLRQVISKSFDLFEKLSVPFFDCVVYTTPIVGNRYKKMRVYTERIENYPVIRASESGKTKRQRCVIYLGGMTEIRGIRELLEAFEMVVAKHPDWQLHLVGEVTPESFAQEVDTLISNLHIEQNTKRTSWVGYGEKETYSCQASIGVVTYLPYANNMSCLPNKLFDYMLVELPVVASNFLLYKEIVEGNECGITVDPANPKEIAKAIDYLIDHPDEAKKMGENGRRAILEKYNWEAQARRLLEVYRRVLDNVIDDQV